MAYYFLPLPYAMAIEQRQIPTSNGNKIKQLRG